MSRRLSFLIVASSLGLVSLTQAWPAMAAPNVYNAAIARYQINEQVADTQISGASAFAELDNKADACEALGNAVEDYNHALDYLAQAAAAPVAADDEGRLSADDIKAGQARLTEKRDKTQAVVNDWCKAK